MVTRAQLTPGTRFRPNGDGFNDREAALKVTYVVLEDSPQSAAFPGPKWINAVEEEYFRGDLSRDCNTAIFALDEIGEIL